MQAGTAFTYPGEWKAELLLLPIVTYWQVSQKVEKILWVVMLSF